METFCGGNKGGVPFYLVRLLLAFLFATIYSWSAAAEEIYTGSGFFITTNGYFVTNYHVIKGAERIGLRDVQGKTYEAIVVKKDTNNDLALLKVKGTFSALPIVKSQIVKRGMRVVTVGFPNIDIQGKEPKLSDGIVSALSGMQDEPTVFQISVPIQQGNSGGPLVNLDGNVVGIVASKLSALYMIKNRGSVPENVSYAIKSNYLIELILTDDLISKSLVQPTKRPARDLVELSERVEKSIALVFAVGRKVDLKELVVQCSQAAKEGNYPDAINLCRQSAVLGDAYSQLFLGGRYFSGEGVSQNYSEAEKWFRLAAAQRDARAQFFLGVMHYAGNGVAQDYQEALKWFRLAAAQGNAGAQNLLSLMYLFGRGIAIDNVRAYMWANLSADQETEHKGKAEELRRIAAFRLTPSQVSEAQDMAAQCLLRKYNDCE